MKKSNCRNNQIRKKLLKIFKECGFKIEDQANLKIVEYLNMKFDLNMGIVTLFRLNGELNDVNTSSNHPRQVIKQIPNGIEYTLSRNSFTSDVF